MKKITTPLKDSLLQLLLNEYPRGLCRIDHSAICKEFSIDTETLITILEIFQANGFIDDLNARDSAIFILLNFPAVSEFVDKGGFQVKHEIEQLNMQRLQLEVQKLQLEIEKLSASFPQAAGYVERLLSTVANIASIVGLAVK